MNTKPGAGYIIRDRAGNGAIALPHYDETDEFPRFINNSPGFSDPETLQTSRAHSRTAAIEASMSPGFLMFGAELR